MGPRFARARFATPRGGHGVGGGNPNMRTKERNILEEVIRKQRMLSWQRFQEHGMTMPDIWTMN
eukprot:11227865-Lingulodinium_polyedra.AAC.1